MRFTALGDSHGLYIRRLQGRGYQNNGSRKGAEAQGKEEKLGGSAAWRDAPSGMAGVTVLMRYTLRLLTLQQFQRATALIAACEVIRRNDPANWGNEPFRIGLWMG